MNGLAGSGNVLSKALPILDPVVFGMIGSSVGATNASMEDAVLQCLQGVLNLFTNTSGDIQAAIGNYGATDSAIAGDLSGLVSNDTPGSIPDLSAALPEAGLDLGAIENGVPAIGMVGAIEDGIPAMGMLGALAEDAGLAGEFDSAVLSRLGGEMLEEAAGLVESDLMSMFRSVSGEASEVGELWGGLTKDQQLTAMAEGRDTIGSLDGIPSEVRNLVNTEELDDLIQQTEAQIEDLRHTAVQADEDHDDDEKAYALCLQQAMMLQVQLGGLQALRGHLQANPNAYLLAIGTDAGGTGRFILAINNPDTADNIATLVPGISTGLSKGIRGHIAAATNLVTAASEADRSQTASVVIWVNYSAPVFADTGAPSPHPPAASVLCDFQNGLPVTNGKGADLHTSVIGNGAGSAIVGAAAELSAGINASDVIALGRPGIGANAIASLRSGAGAPAADEGTQVWVYADRDGESATDYFSPGSVIMPDLAHIIVGLYQNIYHLSQQ